jgi:hypothetical protein
MPDNVVRCPRYRFPPAATPGSFIEVDIPVD